MHKNYGLNELREMFLKFFETKGHLRLPSFSLIPQNDASLLLINSGMAPMKPWFTGEQEPPRHRVTTCQKCIRTGDIENIGHTARHGTYFEMLGNFSFGDYFKTEAIHWAWEFLTSPEWVGLEPDRLYPSVFAGNETTPADDEAFRIWKEEIGIPAERIFKFGKEDNFWEHGSGPCGPCSEIYYDRGPEWGCGKPGCTVGCDCDRYIEVWNVVFSQFDNDGEGHYTELKQKNIDTGMGLERLACVCQNVASLFDVDTVMNITNKVVEITHAHYGETTEKDVSLRVITDHIRSATFMICDGVLPSNEGRGYVLRRLLRRAARHGKLLGVNDPFLYEVCDTVIHENEGHYPELRERQDYITKVIRTEEENFARTIDGGLKIFNDMLEGHKAKGEKVFSGADAFKLYDTYGFPIDLTMEMVAEQGMTVDEKGFQKLMQEQKERARKAREALGDLGWAGVEFGKDVPETEFVGYDHTAIDGARVVALVVENEQAEELMPGVEGIVVLDRTPFYAEMGGQVADHGAITAASGGVFQVTDVQKNKGGKYMHYGKMTGGVLKLGDTVTAAIDVQRRQAVMRAHSATHLLDAVLRKVLGDHVHQAGSLVEPDKLRFDFTHFAALTAEELSQVSAAGQRGGAGGLRRAHRGAPHRGGQAAGRHRPVRREVRRHRPGGGHGPGLLRGVLRRHPPGQHRQGGRVPHRQRVLRGLRRAPDRGHHRPEEPGGHEPQPGAALPGRRRPEGQAGRAAGEGRADHGRAAADAPHHREVPGQGGRRRDRALPHGRHAGGGSEGAHRHPAQRRRRQAAPDGRHAPGQGARRGGRPLHRQRRQDHLPGRLRQGGRGQGHQGRRHHQDRHRHLRRQGRRQAGQRHGRRQRRTQAG